MMVFALPLLWTYNGKRQDGDLLDLMCTYPGLDAGWPAAVRIVEEILLSRGLGIALEGHDTDNAPKGASNGSANCIADSWRAPEGAFLYALVFLLPVNGSMNSFKLI